MIPETGKRNKMDIFSDYDSNWCTPRERPHPDYHLRSPLIADPKGPNELRVRNKDLITVQKLLGEYPRVCGDDIVKSWATFMRIYLEKQISFNGIEDSLMPTELQDELSKYIDSIILGNVPPESSSRNYLRKLNQVPTGRNYLSLVSLASLLRTFVNLKNHQVVAASTPFPPEILNLHHITQMRRDDDPVAVWRFCCHSHQSKLTNSIEGHCMFPQLLIGITTTCVFFWSEGEKSPCVAPLNHLLCWCDTLESRILMYRLSDLSSGDLSFLLSTRQLDAIYPQLDTLLEKVGNKAYDLIKLIEPLCLGELQHRLNAKHTINNNDTFYNCMITEAYEACPKSHHNIVDELLRFIRSLGDRTLLEFFGIYRHWGHPYLEVDAGLRKLKTIARETKCIDTKLMSEFASDCAEIILSHYFRSYGSWPEGSSIPWEKSLILARCIKNNRWPTQHERVRIGKIWHHVKHGRTFDIPNIIPTDILIDDKAHSPTVSELSNLLPRIKKGRPCQTTRRVLLSYLKSDKIDISQILSEIDECGLDDDDMIIGLKGKERELKVEGRFFSLMSFKLRIYFVATEWLLAKYILPLFSEITMMDSGTNLMKRFESNTAGDYNLSNRRQLTFSIHLDYSKWNAHQRESSTRPVFQVIDRALGYNNLISRTHDIFSKCVFYYADKLSEINDLRVDGQYNWVGHLGGVEGLRQKGWSIVGALLLRKVGREFNQRLSILIQGDNQVIILKFDTELMPSDSDYQQEVDRLTKITNMILDRICSLSDRIGLVSKKEETWVSYGLLIYGKYPIVEGVATGIYSKRVSRMYKIANDKVPIVSNSLSMLTTAGLTLAQQTNDVILPICLMYKMQYEAVMSFLSHDVCLGCPGDKVLPAIHRVHQLSKSGRQTQMNVLMFDLLTRDAVVGGLGGCSPIRYMVRQFPDPLNESLVSISIGATHLSKPYRECLLNQAYPKIDDETHWFNLIEDPTSLNLLSSSNIRTVIRDIVVTNLKRGVHTWIKEPGIKEAIKLLEYSTKDLVESLLSWRPILPMLLSNMFEASVPGQVFATINRVDGTRTLVDKSFLESSGSIYPRLRSAYIKSIKTFCTHHELNKEAAAWSCSYERSLEMQRESWGPDIVGVRVPHPLEQFILLPAFNGTCPMCDRDDIRKERISFYLNPAVVSDFKQINKCGPGRAYLGSETGETKATLKHIAARSSESSINKVLKLTRCINWFADPASPVARSIISLLGSICDYPVELFPIPPLTLSGDVLHRFSSNRVSHGGFVPINYTPFTNIFLNSNHLDQLNRSGVNRLIVFQSVFISMSVRIISHIREVKSAFPAYHAHPLCMSCIPICEKVWYEPSPEPHISWPSTGATMDSSSFFARGGSELILTRPRVLATTISWGRLDLNARVKWIYMYLAISLVASMEGLHLPEVLVSSLFTNPVCRKLQYDLLLLTTVAVLFIFECQTMACSQGVFAVINFESLRYRLLDRINTLVLPREAFTHLHFECFLDQVASVSGSTMSSFPPKVDEIINIMHADLISLVRSISPDGVLELLSKSRIGPIVFADTNDLNFTIRFSIGLTLILGHLTSGRPTSKVPINSLNQLLKHRRIVPWTNDQLFHMMHTDFTLCLPIVLDVRLCDVLDDLPPLCDTRPSPVGSSHPSPGVKRARRLRLFAKYPDPYNTEQLPNILSTPIGHFVRRIVGNTTASIKLLSIRHMIPNIRGCWIVCGDGIGGFAAQVATWPFVESIIYNTLPDYRNVDSQSLGSVIPPALHMLNSELRGKFLNLGNIMDYHHDLTDMRTMNAWRHICEKGGHQSVGMICDAETYSDDGWLKIFRNLRSYAGEVATVEFLLIKAHLNQLERLISSHAMSMVELRDYDIIRSPYSQWGNTEVYLKWADNSDVKVLQHQHFKSLIHKECLGSPRDQMTELFRETINSQHNLYGDRVAGQWHRLLRSYGIYQHRLLYPRNYSFFHCLTALYVWSKIGHTDDIGEKRSVDKVVSSVFLHISDIHNIFGLQNALECLIYCILSDYENYQRSVCEWTAGSTRYNIIKYPDESVTTIKHADGVRSTNWSQIKPKLRSTIHFLGMLARPSLRDHKFVVEQIRNCLCTYTNPHRSKLMVIPRESLGALDLVC